MRVPLSWLRVHVDLGDDVTARVVAEALTDAGLKVEAIESVGRDIAGVVVARVLAIEELTGHKKPIRWVTLDVAGETREVVCGATNFVVGDVVAYARPPATLPGGVEIARRTAYGRESDGMICSARELGLGDDHTGILVLDPSVPLGADAVDVLGLADDVLDIAVNPDRGYALSIRGVSREVATALRVPFRDPGLADVPALSGNGYPVRIDDAEGCDRYVARVITGLDPAARSPLWLQRRLVLGGMRPISLAVDVTNHVMLELGQPLHAFDRTRLRGGIHVRRAANGERLVTLDGADRVLDPRDLVIADDTGAIALAGVMGGAATEIDATSIDVVVESAHFDPVTIAYTARRHKLPSEASRRFERGVDPALAPVAAEAAVRLLVELGGATAEQAVTDVDRRSPREIIALDPSMPGRVAGLDYPPAAVRARLADVGCGVEGDVSLQVTPPSWRPDLRTPVDLVEEVVRLEGYDQLPSTVPAAPAGRGLTRAQRQRRQVGRALAGAGLLEVLTYPFVGDGIAEALMLGVDDGRRPSVRLANPVSAEEPFLRTTLLPGLLTAAARNAGRGVSDLALFETGSVFRAAGPSAAAPRLTAGHRPTAAELAALDAALPFQPTHVGAVLTGRREPAGWWGDGRVSIWADAVEAAQIVAGAVGVELTVRADVHAPWHPGRCAALSIDGELVGHAGELHPRVVEAYAVPERTCAFELRLDTLLAHAPELAQAPAMSTYPPATLDVAVVVASGTPAAEVADALRAGGGPLVEDLRLFDVYTGEQVGAGHVSLAFALRLRAPDRTLTAEEAVAVRDAAVAEASRRCGAVLRGA